MLTKLIGYTNNGKKLPSPGLYHYEYRSEDEKSRVHLRIDADLSGTLVVNASKIAHLNPTAACLAYLALEKTPDEQMVRLMRKGYHINKSQVLDDYAQIRQRVDELIQPGGPCPIHEMDLEIDYPFSVELTAPYRMDLAITYRCNNDCSHCYNARPRNYPELTTEQWKLIINKLWKIGIPHIIFTGGEPTLREDLPELISYAESCGQITGLNTNGRRLADSAYLQKLVDAGLDHVQITFESSNPETHDLMVSRKGAWKQTLAGIQNAVRSNLYIMTNTTMLLFNKDTIGDTLDLLAAEGVRKAGLNALIYTGKGANVGAGIPESELYPLLVMARDKTFMNGQELIWYTPTQYCSFDPQKLDLGVKGCSAAYSAMAVEPDGAAIPCQSYYRPLGNMLKDPWEKIWENPLCIMLRNKRKDPQGKCSGCMLLGECGGGCPFVPEQ